MSGEHQTIIKQLRLAFPKVKFLEEEPLSKHTYFKVGGPAEIFAEISDISIFTQIAQFCRKSNISLTVFGGGSNVLVQDKGIRGLVLYNRTSGIEISGTRVVTQSGVPMNILVRKTIDAGLMGLEYFMGLPGTVGGAVVNNSHYKKQLFGDHIVSVQAVNEKGDIVEYSSKELDFSYDHSSLQKTHDIVLSVTLELTQADRTVLEQTAREATLYRAQTQPIGLPSSGCIFKNVHIPKNIQDKFGGKETIGAGWLIDQAGLKGKRVGDAQVSEKHANFIVNTGSATAQDILSLASVIEQEVLKKFGLSLEREIFVL